MCRLDDVCSPSGVKPMKEPTTTKAESNEPRRRVRFEEDDTSQIDIQARESPPKATVLLVLSAEEIEATWYRQPDFETIKQNARDVSRSIRAENATERRPHSYAGVVLRVYSACLTSPIGPSQRDRQTLGRWVRAENSRRGLERWSFPAMMSHREKQRSESIQAVLRLQQAATTDAYGKAEFIRQAYKLHSDPMARMAAVFGEADAAAVRTEREDDIQIEQLCRQKRRLSIGHVQRTAHIEPNTTKVC